MERLNALPDTINKHQMLFGINQGGVYEDIRIKHADEISKLDLDGYAVGGLAVGESHEEMYRILDAVVPHLPDNKPTYLMGVGTPANILEAVDRGVDFFDCVYPSRNGICLTPDLNWMPDRLKRDVSVRHAVIIREHISDIC